MPRTSIGRDRGNRACEFLKGNAIELRAPFAMFDVVSTGERSVKSNTRMCRS
jgi:hypothetical protein